RGNGQPPTKKFQILLSSDDTADKPHQPSTGSGFEVLTKLLTDTMTPADKTCDNPPTGGDSGSVSGADKPVISGAVSADGEFVSGVSSAVSALSSPSDGGESLPSKASQDFVSTVSTVSTVQTEPVTGGLRVGQWVGHPYKPGRWQVLAISHDHARIAGEVALSRGTSHGEWWEVDQLTPIEEEEGA
ncbi:MAG: hypothetical protein ONB06_08530, partial [candidate division KSB1 bacterium]|nr:hypothetical protein [candidate division KSB1 bacterium]